MTLKDLLEKGHVPRELPPPFTSVNFSEFYINSKLKPVAIVNKSSRGVRFSCPKSGLARKTVVWTNPAHQTPLFECINDEWANIQGHYITSQLSYNQPRSISSSSAHGRAIEWTEFKEFRRECFNISFYHKYELRTDISKYYPSIYTHSIPWALHTKEVAKKRRRDNNLLGNKLDNLVRKTQYDQTIGLPIGPDSSIIIAEIIGTQIDNYLRSKIPNLIGHRYVDDMYFYFDSQAEAELCLKEIQHIFKEFELQLNTEKTSISTLPCSIEDRWVIDLRTFPMRSNQIAQLNDIYSYFSLAFSHVQESPNKGVLAYAVRRMKNIFVHHKNMPVYESVLFKVIQVDGSALPDVLRILLSYNEIINKLKLKIAIQGILIHSIPRGYDYEVAWALWYIISFKITLDDYVVKLLNDVVDPISILLILHLESVELIGSEKIDKDSWKASINSESLFDEKWILAYEISVKKWLLDDFSYVDNTEFFNTLKNEKISFFDASRQIDNTNDFNDPNRKIIRGSSVLIDPYVKP